jgi:hypothetical protein
MAAFRATLIVAAVLAFLQALPTFAPAPRAPGRELLATHDLPLEALRRYAALTGAQAEPATAREPWTVGAMWLGPVNSVGVGRNPSTQLLTVSGRARTAGDVRTHWQAGWEVRESANATRDMLMPLTALSSGQVAAGAPVTLRIASGPVSFRGERHAAPVLNLVSSSNLDIEQVQLQVWSGTPPSAWGRLSVERPAMVLLGGVCLALAAPRSRLSRPAPSDLQSLLEHPAPAASSPTTASVPQVAAVASAAAAPTPSPVKPAMSPAANVVAALRDVLGRGLVVDSQPDARRRSRPRSA